MEKTKKLIIYQTKEGAIELKGDFANETIWASQKQLAELFEVNVRTVNDHLINIFKTKELNKDSVIRNFRITAEDGKKYNTQHYNLDAIISVGYRVNSKRATVFRQWATKVLSQHITSGYSINKSLLGKNYSKFIKAIEDVRNLLPEGNVIDHESVLELVKLFANTWFSLDSYDKSQLPTRGINQKQVSFVSDDLNKALDKLKVNLIKKDEATDLFATERDKNSLDGIVGNIFQSFGKQDVYKTIEEKAAHLLYFIVKNHPFVDGNKRSGAFAFIWFLSRAKILNIARITPEALTALTLLVAESNPKDKDKIIGLILLMLRKEL